MVGKRLGRSPIPGSRGERGKVLKIWGMCYGDRTQVIHLKESKRRANYLAHVIPNLKRDTKNGT